MDSFWNVFAAILACFIFGAYLVVLFAVFTDLFRDHRKSGLVKAVWIVFLIVLPVASTLLYVILNGDAMARRARADAEHLAHEEREFVHRHERTPAHQIREAKELLDAGRITDAEFQERKARALD